MCRINGQRVNVIITMERHEASLEHLGCGFAAGQCRRWGDGNSERVKAGTGIDQLAVAVGEGCKRSLHTVDGGFSECCGSCGSIVTTREKGHQMIVGVLCVGSGVGAALDGGSQPHHLSQVRRAWLVGPEPRQCVASTTSAGVLSTRDSVPR